VDRGLDLDPLDHEMGQTVGHVEGPYLDLDRQVLSMDLLRRHALLRYST
jgi:hypothetical protein